MPNRLASETSPYLLQHADNPVAWYPWSDEAFAAARAEEKPVFLSIGYSACHWCHVMAHESFEDPGTAALLNEHFVSIKVDREERPDLDRIYMAAVQAMTGSGGWPMSVFLTPEGRPFYGGTYFPPEPRHGMPAFTRVLTAIAQAWQARREELLAGAASVLQAIERSSALPTAPAPAELDVRTLDAAVAQLKAQFDVVHGGWGTAPKFPQPMVIEFLLRHHRRTGDAEALRMATTTLDAMACGGIYDQIGGGFHRYSVDERWLVPHFEKMLYDNAQLARVYLHAWQLTGSALYRAVAQETLDYIAREMRDPRGGFYSTQDADSEGEEGKFFVWSTNEIRDVLGDEPDQFVEAYGVRPGGNWEGKSILELAGTLEQREELADARAKLFGAREARVHPGRDSKVLTSWNGLMLAAFAEAAAAFGLDGDPEQSDRYCQIAEENAAFLLDHLQTDTGRLFHTWKATEGIVGGGGEGIAKVDGFLEDYANLAEGLLALYQATLAPRWYQAARNVVDAAVARFSVAGEGFYDTATDAERLIARPRELQDNATPSGNSMMATVVLRFSDLAVAQRYAEMAHENLVAVQEYLARAPLGFGQWLVALDYALSRPLAIAIVGPPGDKATRELLIAATSGFRPHQVVAYGPPGQAQYAGSADVPLLEGRDLVDGQPAAYVCHGFACQAPVTEVEALLTVLEQI